MDGLTRGRKILLRDLNAHLICVLCGGYYIDATSISECMHTFCRSCIVKYLETNRFCPICDVQLHKDPLHSISPDKTLQRLVYKMVPGLYSSEMQRRRNFYHSCDAPSSASSAEDADADVSCDADAHLLGANSNPAPPIYYSPDDSISLSLEYYNSHKEPTDEATDVNCCTKKVGPPRRYLKCPAALKMHLLKKFLRTKYSLAPDHKVDIIYADECLPDDFSLMDVAYIFMWNRANPMRFSYRILEWSTVKVPAGHGNTGSATSPQPALTSDSPPDKARQPPSNHTTDKDNSSRGRRIPDDKRRIRESDSETEIKCRQKPKQEPKKRARRETSMKKSRANKKSTLKKKVNNFLRDTAARQLTAAPPPEEEKEEESSFSKETDIKESIQERIEACIQDIDNDISMELLEDQIEEEVIEDDEEPMEIVEDRPVESSQESAKNNVPTPDDKMRDDFILRDRQNENEDLEEEDEYRLRISASEEDCAQEETSAAASVEEVQPESNNIEPEVVESSRNKERKESLKRDGEFRIKRKNKKAKHHHHHRHHDRKRDHHPPAATILPSPDTKDIMKLKVKLTTVKPDDQSKHHHKYNSHSPNRHHNSKHKTYVISDDNEPTTNNTISNGVEENSVKTPKPVEEVKPNESINKKKSESFSSDEKSTKSSPAYSQSSTETSVTRNSNKNTSFDSNSSNKEKLLQMRSIRHKPVVLENNIHEFRSINNNNNNNTIKKNDREVEIEEVKTSNSTILIPPSSITVSKITAAEKKKMDEEKLLKMSGKGNSEQNSKRPSLEIMLVGAPPTTKNTSTKSQEDKQDDKVNGCVKNNSPSIPIVKIQKNHNSQQHNGRQSLLTIAQKLNSNKLLNKNPVVVLNKTTQAVVAKDTKSKQQKNSTNDDVKGLEDKSKSKDVFGALDLSDKSSRKGSSPASSISSDGCPSPNSNFYNLLQRQPADGNQPQTGRSPASNVSGSQASASPKNCIDTGLNVFPPGMRNLMTLSDTAAQIRDMMTARDATDRFKQLARSHQFQQNRSPQRYHSESPPAATTKLPQTMLSPATRAVLASSSPTHLKIPVPRVLPINNKTNTNHRNGRADINPIPDLNEITINRNRSTTVTLNSYANRNGMISKPGPNQAVRHIPNPSIVSFRQNQMKNLNATMPVRPFSPPKKITVNGRSHVMPPPPPAIPLASIRRMESMTRNIEKVAAGLSVKAAVEAGFSVQ